jgi:hypothetical protein
MTDIDYSECSQHTTQFEHTCQLSPTHCTLTLLVSLYYTNMANCTHYAALLQSVKQQKNLKSV